jgi:hypothetical protein
MGDIGPGGRESVHNNTPTGWIIRGEFWQIGASLDNIRLKWTSSRLSAQREALFGSMDREI